MEWGNVHWPEHSHWAPVNHAIAEDNRCNTQRVCQKV